MISLFNILVIMVDDLGWFNFSFYNDGMMGYIILNIDCIVEEGICFIDVYVENSCMVGWFVFIMG